MSRNKFSNSQSGSKSPSPGLADGTVQRHLVSQNETNMTEMFTSNSRNKCNVLLKICLVHFGEVEFPSKIIKSLDVTIYLVENDPFEDYMYFETDTAITLPKLLNNSSIFYTFSSPWKFIF